MQLCVLSAWGLYCGKPPHFRGDEVPSGYEINFGPDHVTLTAASLLTMKSIEIKLQNQQSVCTSEMKVLYITT